MAKSSASKVKKEMKNVQKDLENLTRAASREMADNANQMMAPFSTMQKQMNRMMEESLKTFSSMTNLWAATPLGKVIPKVRVWEDENAFHLIVPKQDMDASGRHAPSQRQV